MLRRGSLKSESDLLLLSLRRGFIGGSVTDPAPRAEILAPRVTTDRYVTKDQGIPVAWNEHNQPITRERADRLFQRCIKRTLAREHFEAYGFYGPCPVEVYSTSPWHSLLARRHLRNAYPEFLPNIAMQTIRIYHEPTAKLSEHCPTETADKAVILDLRELRALIVGSLSADDLHHAISTLANYQLPRYGFLPLSARITARLDGTRPAITFGHLPHALQSHRTVIAASDPLWWSGGIIAAGAEAGPSRSVAHAPVSVVFCCHDETGTLPLAAPLTPEQARFYFERGYGACGGSQKVSEMYGASRLPREAPYYGDLFARRLADGKPAAWVVNTGLVGAESVPGSLVSSLLAAIKDGELRDELPRPGAAPWQLTPPRAVRGVTPDWLRAPDERAQATLRASLELGRK